MRDYLLGVVVLPRQIMFNLADTVVRTRDVPDAVCAELISGRSSRCTGRMPSQFSSWLPLAGLRPWSHSQETTFATSASKICSQLGIWRRRPASRPIGRKLSLNPEARRRPDAYLDST